MNDTTAAGTRTIRGAVLETIGAARPFAGSTPLRVQELLLAAPGPGEIRVGIEAAGVCHSDLSVLDGNRVRPVPMLLGHEAAGIVEELGEGVDDLVVGQRVVMVFLPRCGQCAECATAGRLPCSVGSASNSAGELLGGGRRLGRTTAEGTQEVNHHLGVSAFATAAVVDRRSVVPVDDDVPAAIAAVLGCAVLTGGGAVLNAAKPGPADDVFVVGLGGVGMAALMVARAVTSGRVIGIDQLPEKLELALELGADEAVTPEQAGGRGLSASYVIEAAGHPVAFETAVGLTGPGGTTVTVGLPAPDALSRISPLTLTAQARSIIGCYLGSAVPSRDIPRFVELWRAGRLPLERLITRRITLEEINDAMDELAAGRAVRQVIEF